MYSVARLKIVRSKPKIKFPLLLLLLLFLLLLLLLLLLYGVHVGSL